MSLFEILLLFYFFATFLKKGSAKNFYTDFFSAHSTLDRYVFINQGIKVLVKGA
jgi:hypothetical protein